MIRGVGGRSPDGKDDMRNDNGADFDRWLARADAACIEISGLGIDDLPDGLSYDAWDDGASPEEYARQLLSDEGWDDIVAAVEAAPALRAPVTYGDGSDAAVIASEDVRRANWRPSRQYRGGRYVESSYAPKSEAVEAAVRIRKTTGRLPRLY